MDKYEALVDVIRALTKKCEDYEHHNQMHQHYEERFRREREKTKILYQQLNELGVTPKADLY